LDSLDFIQERVSQSFTMGLVKLPQLGAINSTWWGTKISKSHYGIDCFTWIEAYFDADSNGENRFKIGWTV
jgi:hypothetical protein